MKILQLNLQVALELEELLAELLEAMGEAVEGLGELVLRVPK